MEYLQLFTVVLICINLIWASMWYKIPYDNESLVSNWLSDSSRLKKSIRGSPVAVTQSDISTLISSINDFRSRVVPIAGKMPCVVWSENLRSKAQMTANSCDLTTRTTSQAIFFANSQQPWSNIIEKWYNEMYDIYSDRCFESGPNLCLNYKILFNENSDTLGCAVAKCAKQPNFPSDEFLTVCQFGSDLPHGLPYTTSPHACSGCSPSKLCINYLCCTATIAPNSATAVTVQQTEIDQFLAAINKLRSAWIPTPVRMPCLTWDSNEAAKAQAKALSCNRLTQTKSDTFYFDSVLKSLKEVLPKWSNEYYEIFTNSCASSNNDCLNVKVLINENSDKFGCAKAKCVNRPDLPYDGYMTVCSFNSAVINSPPYAYGSKRCSQCKSPKKCSSGCCKNSL